MTLFEAFTLNEEKSVPSPDGQLADAGQCVSWASYVLKNVYGHPYIFANAINWWQNPGLADMFEFIPFSVGTYPKAGDFVVWGTGVGSKFGHIDACAEDGDGSGFYGYDSNWEDVPRLSRIFHNYDYDILGYIRLKENNVIDTTDQAAEIIRAVFKREPTQHEIDDLMGRSWYDAIKIYRTSAAGVATAAELAQYPQLQQKITALQTEVNQSDNGKLKQLVADLQAEVDKYQ